MQKRKVHMRSSLCEPVEFGFELVGPFVVRISEHKLRFLFVNMFGLQVVHSGDCGLSWLSILWGQKVTSII